MAINCVADVVQAFDEGRSHFQMYNKLSGSITTGQLIDTSLNSSIPGPQYYAGDDLTFTPAVTRSDKVIYSGPNVNSLGYKKYLKSFDVYYAGGGTGLSSGCSLWLNDVVGFYPNVSCETSEEQILDNTVPFPRYSDGVGLRFYYVQVFGNSNAQSITVKYTDTTGVQRTAVVTSAAYAGFSAIQNAYQYQGGAFKPFFDLGSGIRGVKSVDSVTMSGSLGTGLGVIVVVKPVAQTFYQDASRYAAHENDFVINKTRMPEIPDNSSLQLILSSAAGTNANDRIFGGLEFIWG